MKVYDVKLVFSMEDGSTKKMSAAEVLLEAAEDGWIRLKPTELGGVLSEMEAKAEKALRKNDKVEEED